MEPKNTEQQQAHALFYQTELSQQQIADILNVNRKTLYLWIKEGDWLRTKYAVRNAPMQLTERYYAQLQALNDVIAAREEAPYPTKEESEIIKRLTTTIRQLGGRQTLGETVEILSMFLDTIQRQNEPLSKEVIPYMTKHIRSQTQNVPLDEKLRRTAQSIRFDKEYEDYLAKNPDPIPTPTEPNTTEPQSPDNTRTENPHPALTYGAAFGSVGCNPTNSRPTDNAGITSNGQQPPTTPVMATEETISPNGQQAPPTPVMARQDATLLNDQQAPPTHVMAGHETISPNEQQAPPTPVMARQEAISPNEQQVPSTPVMARHETISPNGQQVPSTPVMARHETISPNGQQAPPTPVMARQEAISPNEQQVPSTPVMARHEIISPNGQQVPPTPVMARHEAISPNGQQAPPTPVMARHEAISPNGQQAPPTPVMARHEATLLNNHQAPHCPTDRVTIGQRTPITIPIQNPSKPLPTQPISENSDTTITPQKNIESGAILLPSGEMYTPRTPEQMAETQAAYDAKWAVDRKMYRIMNGLPDEDDNKAA